MRCLNGRVSIGLSVYDMTAPELLDLARAADEAGFDTLWLGDGLFRRPDFAGWRGGLESLTELAYLAGRAATPVGAGRHVLRSPRIPPSTISPNSSAASTRTTTSTACR